MIKIGKYVFNNMNRHVFNTYIKYNLMLKLRIRSEKLYIKETLLQDFPSS